MNEIKREIEYGKEMYPLFFKLANSILPQLKISNESIKYYASLVEYYSVYKLKRFNESLINLYLLCFIFHRYQRMNDNLINSFIYKMKKYNDDILSFAKDQVYNYYTENQEDFKKVGNVLQVIIDEKAFRWERIDALALQFKRQIRPIFMTIDFVTTDIEDSLMDAIHFLKRSLMKRKTLLKYDIEDIPQTFIQNGTKRYLYTKDAKRLLIDRYEFLIYHSL
jgi:hypothetical protein